MIQLQDHDFVTKVKGERGLTHHYEITNQEEYQQLKDGVNTIMNATLEVLKRNRNSGSLTGSYQFIPRMNK